MRSPILLATSLLACGLSVSCGTPADDFKPETVIAMERAALDRWGHGDPNGYLETYAPEVTYFDPVTDKRIDGLEAMRKYYAPLIGKIKVDRYEMLNLNVQHHGDVAVLSYNLLNYGVTFNGEVPPDRPWNSTKIYARINGQWKIVHDHWSYIKPVLK